MKNMEILRKFFYPKSWVFWLAFILSMIMVFQYIAWVYFPPIGTSFNGYDAHEGQHLAGVRSIEAGFRDYWTLPGEDRPDNVIINSQGPYGPIYLQIIIGIIHLITALPIIIVWIMFRFFSTFFFVLAGYHLFGYITDNENERNISFLLYFLSAGVGGYLYLLLLTSEPLPQIFFGFGTGGFRILGYYLAFSLTLSFASIILNMKGRIMQSSVLMGINVLIYPAHALTTLGINYLYHILYSEKKIVNFVKLAICPVLFSLFWIIPYIIDSRNFEQYFIQNTSLSYVFLPSLISGIGMPLIFAAYACYRGFNINYWHVRKKIMLAVSVVVVASGLSLATLADPRLLLINSNIPALIQATGLAFLVSLFPLLTPAVIVIFAVLIAYAVYYSLYSYADGTRLRFLTKLKIPLDNKQPFIFLWILATTFVALLPPGYTIIFPDKMVQLLYIPVMVLAAKGIIIFSEKIRVTYIKVLILLILLSFPTVFFWHYFRQIQPRYEFETFNAATYFYQEEYEALKFLEQQPQGVIFSSGRIGIFIPYHTNKKTVNGQYSPLFELVLNDDEKEEDYRRFYNVSDEERHEILKKYGVTYLFFDKIEQEKYGSVLDNTSYLEKIYDQGVVIFRIKDAP